MRLQSRIAMCMVSSAAMASTMVSTAAAQTVPAAEHEGEIVVTAQKRTQNIQDVPVSVQVVGEAQLEANAVREFTDLNRVSPSLTIRPTENPQSANIQIRGIGTLAFSPSVEPSVAIIMDDVALAFQSRAFTDMSGIERIEVLRGPQSTLYGKSASAGLINIVTKGPSRDLTFGIDGMVTTDNEQQIGAYVSGPITSTLGFRSSANFNDFEGNTLNVFDGEKVNGRRYFSVRNKLRWNPSADLQVDIGIDYADGKTTATRPFIEVGPGAILRGNAAYTQSVFAPGILIGADNTDVAIDFISGNRFDDFAQSLRISYDTGGPTLMSITAHDRYNSYDSFDSDDSAIGAFQNFQYGNFHSEQFSQELRLVSPDSQRLRYTLGLYYNDVSVDRDFYRGPIFALSNWDATTGSNQIAAFGQLEFDPIKGTTLIAGGRYSREKIDYTYLDLRTSAQYAGKSEDDFGTYKLGVLQEITPDINAFITYATGHKGEAYDISSGFNQVRANAGPIRPETSDDLQFGLRTLWLDRKLMLNVTLFTSTFKDFQTQAIDDVGGALNFRLTNVGKLRTRGIEVETVVRPSTNLTINASAAYVDAQIKEFAGAPCYSGQTAAQGCVGSPASQDLSGTELRQAPEWKFNVSYDLKVPMRSGGMNLLSQGAISYQSEIVPLDRNPKTIQPGYAMVNLAIGVGSDDGWKVMAFVNNLFDQHYRYLINDVSSRYGTTAIQGYVPRDFYRYGGIRASYSF